MGHGPRAHRWYLDFYLDVICFMDVEGWQLKTCEVCKPMAQSCSSAKPFSIKFALLDQSLWMESQAVNQQSRDNTCGTSDRKESLLRRGAYNSCPVHDALSAFCQPMWPAMRRLQSWPTVVAAVLLNKPMSIFAATFASLVEVPHRDFASGA